jgi:hypothetical protein
VDRFKYQLHGVISDREARQKNVGGEVFCEAALANYRGVSINAAQPKKNDRIN